MATRTDITLIRGDNSSIGFELTQDSTAVDLTGATVFFTAKPTLANESDDASAVIHVEVTDHTDPTNGKTSIPLSASDTNITPGTYYYDVQVKTAAGNIISIPARRLEVVADVTRRTA